MGQTDGQTDRQKRIAYLGLRRKGPETITKEVLYMLRTYSSLIQYWIVRVCVTVSRTRLCCQFKLSATSVRASLKCRTRLQDWRPSSVSAPTQPLYRPTLASG